MPVTTGLNRLFGINTQQRISELRRTGAVATSEVTGDHTAAGSFPTTVDIIRREESSAGTPAAGIPGVWSTVAGLDALTGHVRTRGRWADEEKGAEVDLTDAQRIVLIADIPAGGEGAAGELLASDRLRFTDPVRGLTTWEVEQVRTRKPDGLTVALVEYARED